MGLKPKNYWVVWGQSWGGKMTKRNGKVVSCGHKHKSWKTAQPCVAKMRKARPGNCQTYGAIEIVFMAMRRRAKIKKVKLRGVVAP